MINGITSTLERKAPVIRRLGKKVFDIKEIDAHAYLRRDGNTDILTVLDKDHKRLLVQNTKPINAGKQESVIHFYSGFGRPFKIKSTMTRVSI